MQNIISVIIQMYMFCSHLQKDYVSSLNTKKWSKVFKTLCSSFISSIYFLAQMQLKKKQLKFF